MTRRDVILFFMICESW